LKSFFIILFIVTSVLVLPAGDFSRVGTTGFVFLEIPVSARYAALGETGITLTDVYSEGLFINPALITLTDKSYAWNINYARWYVETNHQSAGVTAQIPAIGAVGVQIIYFDFGDIEKTRNPDPAEYGSYIDLGSYSANALALGLTFARNLTDQFAFGFTTKYVREAIDIYQADNIIWDLGFLYQTGFHTLRIGATLQNFGLDTKYVTDKFKMPQLLKIGLSAEIWGNREQSNYLTFLAEAAHPNDIEEHLQLGLEGIVFRIVAVRAGYKSGYEEENFTFGLGIRFMNRGIRIKFDLAYMQHQRLEGVMRYGLSMEF
jgi:hypothetical protein